MAFMVSFEDSDSDSDSVVEPKTPPSSFPKSFTAPRRVDGNPTTQPTKPINLPLRQIQNHSFASLFSPSENTSRAIPIRNKMETPPSTPPSKPTLSKPSSDTDVGPRRSTDSTLSDAPPLSSSAPPGIKPFLATYTLSSTTPPLGAGLWSTVLLAHPSTPSPSGLATPPHTPSRATTSSQSAQLYAVKTPTSNPARAVLASEARVLTYLTSRPSADAHIVRFFGLDARNGALVLGAAPQTLEGYVTFNLNAMGAAERGERLRVVFPRLAARLVAGLEWMNGHGVVHGDVKGGNILLLEDGDDGQGLGLVPRFADFSSARICADDDGYGNHTTTTDQAQLQTRTPLAGGGTWDYLSPTLIRRPTALPTFRTDLHSLAVTLLYVIFGSSPFDALGANVFLRREMVKQNLAMQAGMSGPLGERRMRALEEGLGWDVGKWVERGLGEGEVNGGEWREDVEGVVRRMDSQG